MNYYNRPSSPHGGASRRPVAARLRSWWQTAGAPLRLVVINAVIFVILKSVMITMTLLVPPSPLPVTTPLSWLALPGSWGTLALRPWTLLTYMFTHYDVWHLLFNMLWLYWFGGLLQTVATGRQVISLYILGGLGGALFFMLTATVLPGACAGGLIGSSAAVIALVTAVAILMPHLRVRLMLFGEVRVLWVAIATIIIVAIPGSYASPIGSQAAHAGGALAGVAFALLSRRGIDITRGISAVGDHVVNLTRGIRLPRASHSTRVSRDSRASREAQSSSTTPPRADISDILDKVKRSGYASLTPDERARLFGQGRR